MTDQAPTGELPSAVRAALRTTLEALDEAAVPVLVGGAIAARGLGAAVRVERIDLFIRARDLPSVQRLPVARLVTFPWPRTNEQWDLVTLQMEVAGILVVVGVLDGARGRASADDDWTELEAGDGVPLVLGGETIPALADARWTSLLPTDEETG